MNLPTDPDPPAEAVQEPAAQEPAAQAGGTRPRAARKDTVPRHVVMRVLERLAQLHPKLFGARFLPLKLGAYEDLLARHPGVFERDELKAALGFHARSTRYLEAVATSPSRHDLDGNPVEELAPEHVHHAVMEAFRRRQQQSKQDLKPWLLARLVSAIQRSGLPREEYVLRVAPRDEASQAVLDEAFAQIAAGQARSEAIRRAFEASGEGVEAFAQMYGIPVDAVNAALRQDHADRR